MLSNITGLDYGLLALSLMVPVMIAFYYAYVQRLRSPSSFLLANRKLNPLASGFSLALTYTSSTLLLLETPGKVAYHGLMVPFTTGLMALASVLIITNLFLPILYKIRMCSVYEYLDLRYNSSWVRRLAALSFLTGMILFSSLILQSPCAAVHTMTGLPTFSVLLLVGIIGTFYTVMGGLKAVVWAGLFQAMLALTILLAIFVKGSLAFPDLEHIWNVVQVTERAEWFNWDPSPFVSHTTWSTLFGQLVLWSSLMSCHQTQFQRFCSTRSVKKARWSLTLSALMMALLFIAGIISSGIIYATFWNCDAISGGLVARQDELTTLFVTQKLQDAPGLPGVYLAALLGGTLSTFSMTLMSVASVVWDDFLRHLPHFHLNATEERQTQVTRAVATSMGLVIVAMSYLIITFPAMGSVAKLAIPALAGPLLAIFVLGFFTSTANKIGAMLGFVSGNAVTIWLMVGHVLVGDQSQTLDLKLDFLNLDCNAPDLNATNIEPLWQNRSRTSVEEPQFFYVPTGDWQEVLYATTPELYPVIGFLICFLVTLFASLISRLCHTPRPVEPLLLHPMARFRSSKLHGHPGGHMLPNKMLGPLPTSHMGYNDSAWVYGPPESHFRWPSPSLPPTLNKGKGHRTNKRNTIGSDTNISGETSSSGRLASTSTEVVSSNGTSAIIKPFSRQNVISVCEMASQEDLDNELNKTDHATTEDSDCDSDNSSHSSSNDDKAKSDDVESIEIDEFGDIVPPHLRRRNREKQRLQKRTRKKKQVYKVQEAEKKNLAPTNPEVQPSTSVDKAGWDTDF